MKKIFKPSSDGLSTAETQLHIGLFLWPHYSLLSLSGLMETLLHAAKTQKEMSFKITLISEFPDTPIISNTGVSIRPDCAHTPPDSFNYVVTIGGSLQYLNSGYRGDREYLTLAHRVRVPLIGIGTGSFVLAQEGFLNDRRASVHPFHLDTFRRNFPQIYADQCYDFIDEGDVLTCPGGISTITLATELIRAHAGNETASTTCQRFSIVPNELATPHLVNIPLIPDLRLRRVVMLIEQHLTRPLSTARLASEVALSERQLNRLFHAEFGKTTREFICRARLHYSCWLLKNSQQSVTNIALRMGFCDCAHFIRHFQTEYGCTPGVWRASKS